MSEFKQLGVDARIIKRLTELNIIDPTEIQTQSIPFLAEKGSDFIGMSQTGTGKTAAYSIPLLQNINVKNNNVQALILAPTRELVQQIAKNIFKFTKYYKPIFSVSITGGPNMSKQLSLLNKNTHIIVATPGRLMDLLGQQKVNLENLKYVVLDEADEMLKLGFKEDIEQILSYSKGKINTWLFSATLPQDIKKLIQKHLKVNAHSVIISEKNVLNKNIKHEYISCNQTEKLNTLIQYLKLKNIQRGLIFCKTKKATTILTKQLKSKNILCEAIQGDLTQLEREKVMRAFKNESLGFLVSTDVSARGIDVENLDHVIHYEMPDQTDYYTHRSGRTARGGKKGLSIAFVDEKELALLKKISKALNFEVNETIL